MTGNASKLSDQRDALMAVVKNGPISGGSQRNALAADGRGAMGLGRAPNSGERGDTGTRTAGAGLPQALGSPMPSWQDRAGAGGFYQSVPSLVEKIATNETSGKLIAIWFADEACVNQKGKITGRRAKRGTRQSAPRDLRIASACISCPNLSGLR
jgi:hypothetical protein